MWYSSRQFSGWATLASIGLVALGVCLGIAALAIAQSEFVDRVMRRVHAVLEEAPTVTHSTQYSNLYNVMVTTVETPFRGRDGAVTALSDEVLLLANFEGRFWLYRYGPGFEMLPFRAPTNVEEFRSSPVVVEQLSAWDDWVDRTTARFGLKDILVRSTQSGITVYAAYTHWREQEGCLTIRVSSLEVAFDGSAVHTLDGRTWEPVFETSPCLSLNRDGMQFRAEEGGGRMALLNNDEMLIAIGDFNYASVNPLAQRLDNSYGKTIRIDLTSGRAEIFTSGHRNPQGLTVTSEGTVYSSEHGPVGGDELNLLVPGGNYGWPAVSYGRDCLQPGCLEGDRAFGRHDGYDGPIYSWVPSVGISSLDAVEKDLFDRWRGDLLVGSLGGRTLYRVRIRDGRAVVVEPALQFDKRIRDIEETPSGKFVIKTDGKAIYILEPDESVAQQLISGCVYCHTYRRGDPHAIGPNLSDVAGRSIASAAGFQFSHGLRKKGGRWTHDNLVEFLLAPSSFAPGTSMPPTELSRAEAEMIVEFLQGLED